MAPFTHRPFPVPRLTPASFAIVMATGIVSLAANQQGMHIVSLVLFWLNVGIYALLWLLTAIHAGKRRATLLPDLVELVSDPAVFASVAATAVIGSQIVALVGSLRVAAPFWFLATALWFLLTYSFFVAVIVRRAKPTLDSAISGLWLLPVVATQAVSFLGTRVAALFGAGEHTVLLGTLALWLAGCMLYLLIIGMIVYRLIFFPVTAAQLTAPYWINMGALAISTLAGAELGVTAARWSVLRTLLPFLHGLSLFFWAAGTWWIPLLLALGVWRHRVRGHPLHYHVEYWGIVFPVGMYCAATYILALATGIDDLLHLAQGLVYVALAVWAITFAGLLTDLWTRKRQNTREAAQEE